MLALLLGSVLAYQQCNNVTSCFLQVNGSRPLIKLVGTLPLGGFGYAFTTTDCMRGLIALDENCECQNSTLSASGSTGYYCYSSGNWAQKDARSYGEHFCKNQNGINTFSLLNSSSHTQCKCFDPISGRTATASITEPVCKEGDSQHKPCPSTDGTGDNALVLAKLTGATLKAVLDLSPWYYNPADAFPRCSCGTTDCRASPAIGTSGGEDRPYCQAEINHCSKYKICPKGVFTPKDKFAQQNCECGESSCYAGTKCESKVIDGLKQFVCTLEGRSSNFGFLVKTMAGSAGLGFVFALVAFVFMICLIIFSTLTFCKVNKK